MTGSGLANPRFVLAVLLAGYLLNSFDRSILSVLLEPIGREFGVSDTQLGLLTGLAFAAVYSTLGIPIAALADRTSRRNVLALSILVWSVMTVVCGLATSFLLLLLARIGTGIGEAGGTPPSHSLISDYFPTERRATALAIYSVGAPAGAALAGLLGGYGNEWLGWRTTMVLAGLPGLLLAPLVLFSITEPRRVGTSLPRRDAASLGAVARHLWRRASFRHLCVASSLHCIAVQSASSFNATFLMRSHGWGTAEAGGLFALLGVAGALGTLLGGALADRLNRQFDDARWLLWVPGLATLTAVPFQAIAYLGSAPWTSAALPMAALLSMMFFGPAFAVGQSLAAPGMRAVTASVLLFAMAMIGMGLGPLLTGMTSDTLMPQAGRHSLRYALLLAPLFNLWSVVHFHLASRHLRDDLGASLSVRLSPGTA